jgi:hypothetical protein
MPSEIPGVWLGPALELRLQSSKDSKCEFSTANNTATVRNCFESSDSSS